MEINTKCEDNVRGSKTYVAPEILQAMNLMIDKLRYDNERADVFSMGFVLLEMIIHERLTEMNGYKNYGEFIMRINDVSWEWARDLLQRMIQIDPWERPSFYELRKD